MKPTIVSSASALHVAVGVVKNATGHILIALRHDTAHQGGLWEFPGGKVEAGESVEQALSRELKEELNISAKVNSFFSSNLHEVMVHLHFFFLQIHILQVFLAVYD